jgi:hypothetical protein
MLIIVLKVACIIAVLLIGLITVSLIKVPPKGKRMRIKEDDW